VLAGLGDFWPGRARGLEPLVYKKREDNFFSLVIVLKELQKKIGVPF
jgi:hypothetical protein